MSIRHFNIFILSALSILTACQSDNTTENKKLTQQLDSVNQELVITRQALLDYQQIKALLDSIDASRNVTTTPLSTGEQNNINRLNDLNEYVRDINMKIDQMEKSIRYVNTMAASILKLQADIEVRSQKIATLEAEAKNRPAPNKDNSKTIKHKDSTLAVFVKNCQQDIAVLQKTMEEVHAKNNQVTAELYYSQAETLVAMAANVNTNAKRKLVKREALEMYKISNSLGKKEAQQKISGLEAEL